MIDIFYFDRIIKKGAVKDLPKLKDKKIWVDVTDIKKEDVDILKKVFNLHPVTEEDLMLSHGRIKIEQFPNYLFTTFYSIEKKGKKINVFPLEYVIGDNFIITTHKHKLENYEKLKSNKERLKNLFREGVELVFHRLLDEQIDEFFPVLEYMDDEIEELDKKIVECSAKELLENILEMKRKIVEIKKVTFPQREKISFLTKRKCRFISEETYPYFRDVYDQSIRVSDVVENFREAVGSSFDTYITNVANNTNDIMKVLSIIATIALPLTVVSGIYGTNFINIPGLKTEDGFINMILIMCIMILTMIIFFKKKRWF